MRRSPAKYRDCAARGLSKSETARALAVSVQCVDDMAVRHGIAFTDGRDAANKRRAKDQNGQNHRRFAASVSAMRRQ